MIVAIAALLNFCVPALNLYEMEATVFSPIEPTVPRIVITTVGLTSCSQDRESKNHHAFALL